MALDMSREKEAQDDLKGQSDSKTWKVQDGPNRIRVFKFEHKVTKADVEEKLYDKKDIGKTVEKWNFPFMVHFGLVAKNSKIPVLSTSEIMAEYQKLRKSKLDSDQKRADAIKPNKKYAMNIMDLNAPEKGVQIYLAPKTVRQEIGKYVTDEDYGEGVLGIKGRDFKIEYNKAAKDPKDYYKIIIGEKDKSRPINSKILDGVKDLFDPKVNSEFAQIKSMQELEVPSASAAEEDLEGSKSAAEPEKKKAAASGGIFDDAEPE